MDRTTTFAKTCPQFRTRFVFNQLHRRGFVIITFFTIEDPKYIALFSPHFMRIPV